jgi:signal transduction histidine kinase
VAITIEASLAAINITVQDNGRGASLAAFEAADAYGVMGMRERARHLGGTIAISSQPGVGSSFHLCIQLQHPSKP